MPEVTLQYWAILVSAIVAQIIGMLWYSPVLFGKQLIALMGWENKTPEEMKQIKKKAKPAYLVSFIAALVMAYVLSHVIDYAQAKTIQGGLQAGLWMWLGFVGTVNITNAMYDSSRPKMLTAINSGYFLVVLLCMGAIIAAWV